MTTATKFISGGADAPSSVVGAPAGRTSPAVLLAVVLLFAGLAPAAGADITISISLYPAEVVALQKTLDRQPISEVPPPGFWSLQARFANAVDSDPAMKAALAEQDQQSTSGACR